MMTVFRRNAMYIVEQIGKIIGQKITHFSEPSVYYLQQITIMLKKTLSDEKNPDSFFKFVTKMLSYKKCIEINKKVCII
jgi:hypothetical protein